MHSLCVCVFLFCDFIVCSLCAFIVRTLCAALDDVRNIVRSIMCIMRSPPCLNHGAAKSKTVIRLEQHNVPADISEAVSVWCNGL